MRIILAPLFRIARASNQSARVSDVFQVQPLTLYTYHFIHFRTLGLIVRDVVQILAGLIIAFSTYYRLAIAFSVLPILIALWTIDFGGVSKSPSDKRATDALYRAPLLADACSEGFN